MKMNKRQQFIAAAFSALGVMVTVNAQAAVTFVEGSYEYSQNFNSLPNINGSDPAWTNNATLAGWYFFAGPNLDQNVSNIRVSTSSGSDRAHVSYGMNGDSDRALGFQGGSTHRYSPVTPSEYDTFGAIAVAFVNGTNVNFNEFAFNYTGEQWYISSNANRVHYLTVEYAIGNTGTEFNQLNWQSFDPAEINPAGVDFYTPSIIRGTTGNGNLPENRVEGLGASVTSLDWAPGDALWLRWTALNFPASDHGMAIDDFSISVKPVPLPAAIWMMLAGLGGLASTRHRFVREL